MLNDGVFLCWGKTSVSYYTVTIRLAFVSYLGLSAEVVTSQHFSLAISFYYIYIYQDALHTGTFLNVISVVHWLSLWNKKWPSRCVCSG